VVAKKNGNQVCTWSTSMTTGYAKLWFHEQNCAVAAYGAIQGAATPTPPAPPTTSASDWTFTNVGTSGAGLYKTASGNAYDASAVTNSDNMVIASLTMGAMDNMHRRLGLTTNSGDHSAYAQGNYIGLFPNGRLYCNSGGADGTWAEGDAFTIAIQGGNVVAKKNGNQVCTWSTSMTTGYAKFWFHEQNCAVTAYGANIALL